LYRRTWNRIAQSAQRLDYELDGTGVWIPAKTSEFCVFLISGSSVENHLASYSMGRGNLFPRKSSWGIYLTSDLHQVSRIGLRAARVLRPLRLHS
jgi:hypothetical protein